MEGTDEKEKPAEAGVVVAVAENETSRPESGAGSTTDLPSTEPECGEKTTTDPESPPTSTSSSRYSAFTQTEKRIIVAAAGYAAWFSTLSSFIYYPALDQLATTLNVSVDRVNLTVTSYMAVATVAPTLVGDFADVMGRRPAFVVCLGLYLVANVAIALAKTWGALLGLRVLQALAISGTFSLAYGVVTDVATPAERGSFVSAVSFGVTIAPTLGPILGGALAFAAGWPWIFWFLAIASGAGLVMIVFVLPETSRGIVGDGTIPPPLYLRLPAPLPKDAMRYYPHGAPPPDRKEGRQYPNPLRSLGILLRPDNTVLILAVGLLYVVYTCINASLSVLFIDIYSLNQWQAGLIYIPFGVGGTVSTLFSGKLLDGAYRRARAKLGLSTDRAAGDDLDAFAIERARLVVVWVPMAITAAMVVAFGWVLHYEVHIAAPLAIQFVAGMVLQLDFSICNTLLVDKNHRRPAAAQATSNIVRCALAAIMVAFLQNLLDAIGTGWTFTLMAALTLVAMGLFAVDYVFGTAWRQQALRRQGLYQ